MDHFRNFDHSNLNGVARSGGDASVDRRKRNYKLVLDPTLKPGSQKVYRFDGSLPGETTPLIIRDPRSRMKRFWTRREPALLPIPKFKYDEYYVGVILPKEVTFCHLNDNINQSFLFDMCKTFGNVEECNIYYHPKTKKHLGLGRVLFTSTRAARQCCEKLHNTSKMGKIMTVIVDSMGAERDRMYSDLIADKPLPRPMSPKTPQAKDPRHKLVDLPPSLEMPAAVDRPVPASDRSASTDHSGFWTPGSGSAASSDRGYGTSSLPYPDSIGGYSTTPSGQSDMSYPPSAPHTPQVGFIDGNMMQMAPPPVTGFDGGMPGGEGIMFNADSFQHPPPQFGAQPGGYEAQPHNFDRSYKQPQQPPQRPGYGQYDQSFGKKERGRDRRESRWEWNDNRDRQRRDRHRGGKDRGRYHSHHKGRDEEREHRERDRHRGGAGGGGEWGRDHGKDWNNGRNRDWENGREWEEGRQWDSGGVRPRDWEGECNSRDGSWNKDMAEQQQYPPPPLPQPPLQLQQPPPSPMPPSVPLMPPTHIPPVPPPQSAPMLPPPTVAPPMPDITTAPPPLPHPVMAPPPARLSPEIDSRRSTSLEARIQSLLRQNSDFDDAGGDVDQPAPPDDDAPPLPPTTEDVEPPPLPPEPEECAPPLPEESAPPLPTDADGEAVCDIPSNGILSSGEMLSTFHTWATSDFVQEESVEVGADRTPVPATDAVNVTEVTSADIAADAAQKTVVEDDDDDHMSLSSLSSGEEKLEVTAPPPPGVMQQQHPPPGGVMFASPTLLPTWALDAKLQMQNMYGMSMMTPMPGTSFLNSPSVNHEYEEEQMFSGVLEKVIAELRVVMMKDLSKKMVETSAFKSFEGWWDNEKNRQKSQKIIPNTTDKISVAKATTAPTPKISDFDSISTLFDNQSKGLGRAFGVGGILGLRGAVPKLPSFRRKFRPPSPPPPDEKFRGPRTPEGSDNDDVSDVESLPAKGKTKKPLIDDTDKSDSDSDDDEEDDDDEEEESSSGASEDEESEEASSADEEDEDEDEDVEMQSDKDESDAEQDISKPGTSHKEEQEKPKLENGDVTKTPEAVTSEDSRSRLSPIIEVEQPKNQKRAPPDETTTTETDVSKKSIDAKKDIDTAIDAKDTSNDAATKNGDLSRPVAPPAGDGIAEKDSIEQLAEVDVCSDHTTGHLSVDSGLEKDVAMALLQMHDDQLVVSEPAVTPPKPEEPPHYTMTAEHNYFAPPKSAADKPVAPPGGKHVTAETDLTDSASEGEPNLIPCLPPTIQADHNYCRPFHPVEEGAPPCKKRARKRTASTSSNILSLSDIDNPVAKVADSEIPEALEFVEVEETKKPKKKTSKAKAHGRKLADVTNLSRGSRELASLLPTIVEKPSFTPRPMQQEMAITYEFLFKGIDVEDVAYLQQRYEELLQDDSMQTYWLHDTHWVEHTHTLIPNPAPPKKKRRHTADATTTMHTTGAARTEGYYKISHHEKSGYLRHARGVQESQNADSDGPRLVFDPEVIKKKAEKSREARSESRRWQNVLSSMGEDCGDLLKFNQLKFRKKSLHFCRSGIHDWGLFALEPIAADEMVVEYVGQVIRQTVADQRERRYEAMGLGSSYLFRIDHDTIIDATKDGNMARFINHSCNPNCYAKIINVDALKKIVIYSRREIKVNEEVTYDYKFPIEDKKIPCFCGASCCRGSLN